MMDPAHTPDGLEPQRGGRRVTRVPLYVALGLATLMAGAIGYTYHDRLERQRAEAGREARAPEPAEPPPPLRGAPDAGVIPALRPPAPEALPPEPAPPPPAVPAVVAATPAPDADAAEALRRAWERHDEERARVEEERRRALAEALTAETTVPAGRGGGGLAALTRQGAGGRAGVAGLEALSGGSGGAGRSGGVGQGDAVDLSGLRAGLETPYLNATREPPRSAFELKAGSVIPGVMIGGVSSDLPGTLVAQVRQNVYDTATGRRLLIPQGARLVGRYDSRVAPGQERVEVAWTRLVFPDASSLELGGMPGADQGGYGGLTDRVNNHVGRVIGNALLLSVFSAGVQLSQPQPRGGSAYDSQQIAAGALGQQLGRLGSEYARRGLDVAPTLEVRPGYRFTVMVTKDIVLPPWRE